jgi:hypothetical protein
VVLNYLVTKALVIKIAQATRVLVTKVLVIKIVPVTKIAPTKVAKVLAPV